MFCVVRTITGPLLDFTHSHSFPRIPARSKPHGTGERGMGDLVPIPLVLTSFPLRERVDLERVEFPPAQRLGGWFLVIHWRQVWNDWNCWFFPACWHHQLVSRQAFVSKNGFMLLGRQTHKKRTAAVDRPLFWRYGNLNQPALVDQVFNAITDGFRIAIDLGPNARPVERCASGPGSLHDIAHLVA